MAFHVVFAPAAARQFADLPRQIQTRLRPRIDALADDPRPAGVERLTGATDLYRLRVGDYRVIFAIQDQELIVLIVRVAHRREVYRRLPS
jgi:mRNA interferase RelE/StbE